MRATWETGQRVVKNIGFDTTEDHRTFATGGGMNICPTKGLPKYGDRYEMRYPLREWGLDRAACIKIIAAAGLPVPPKSSCWFCPAMKRHEIESLAKTDPDLALLALEMERLYRAGKHFRGDGLFTVRAEHRQTKEKIEVEIYAVDVATAREQFRNSHDDTQRPYKYKLGVSSAVVGLGRGNAWKDIIPGTAQELTRLVSLPMVS